MMLSLTLLAALSSTPIGPPLPQDRQPAGRPTERNASGRVIDVLGEPIPAATVHLVRNGRTIARTATDAEGIYHVGNMPEDGADLLFRATGKAELRLGWRGPTTPVVRHVTLEDATVLEGRVFDSDGLPVPDAEVVVACPGGSLHTRTGQSGRFTFDAVPLRQVCVRAIGPRSFVQRSLRLTDATECELRLPDDGAQLRTVRVTGLPSAALDLAFVRVTSPDQSLLPAGGRIRLGADGSAQLMLGEWALVEPVVPGFTSQPAGMIALGGGSTLDFRLVAEQPGVDTVELTGRVRTLRNRTVADQLLVIRDPSDRDLATGTVDRDGRFCIRVELPSTRLCRIGMALDQWELVDDERLLRDGFTWVPVLDSSKPIDLWVQRTGSLTCPVRTADGSLLALAEVVVTDPELPFRALVATTCDRSGLLQLALPIDQYDLLVVAHDGTVRSGTVRFGHNGTAPIVRWHPIATGWVTGRLVDADGAALPGVQLYFASTEITNANSVHAGQRQDASVRTDRDGRFRCRGLPAGEWTVVALDAEHVTPARVAVAADQEARLQLRQAPR